MENNNWSFNSLQQQSTVDTSSVSKTFIASVYSWLGVALAISAVTAYVFGNDMSYLSYLINESTGKLSGLGYLVMFAPIGFVLLMSFGFQRLSSTALTGLFLVYAVIMGMSLSFIFLAYTTASVYVIFSVSAAMFGLMAKIWCGA